MTHSIEKFLMENETPIGLTNLLKTDSEIINNLSQSLSKKRQPEIFGSIEFLFKLSDFEIHFENSFQIEHKKYENLQKLNDFILQNKISEKSGHQKKETIFKNVSEIVNHSQNLITEKSNISHLQMEIQSNLSHFISKKDFNAKIDFFDEINLFEDYCNHYNDFNFITMKIINGCNFFLNRQNFKEYSDQMENYQHIVSRIEKSGFNFSQDLFMKYFELLKAHKLQIFNLFKSCFLVTKNYSIQIVFFNLLNFDCYFENQLKETGLIENEQAGPFFDEINGLFTKKSIPCKNLNTLIKNNLSNSLFKISYQKIQQLFIKYVVSFLNDSLEMFFSKDEDPLIYLAQISTFILAGIASVLSLFSDQRFSEIYFLSKSIGSIIKTAAEFLRSKIKQYKDFAFIIELYKKIQIEKKKGSEFITNLFWNNLISEFSFNQKDKISFYKNTLSIYEPQIVSLWNVIFEQLDFQVDYMLNKIIQQSFLNEDKKMEVESFMDNAKIANDKKISLSAKVFIYLDNSLKDILDNDNFFTKKGATLAIKKILKSAPVLGNSEISFLFTLQNLQSIFSNLETSHSLETLFEFSGRSEIVSNIFTLDEKSPDKFEGDNFPFFVASLVNILINNQICSFNCFFSDDYFQIEKSEIIFEELKAKILIYKSLMKNHCNEETISLLKGLFFANLFIYLQQLISKKSLAEVQKGKLLEKIIDLFEEIIS